MRKVFFLIACLCITSPVFAIKAPIYQSITEINSMLNCEEIARFFGPNAEIQEIKRAGDSFMVSSEDKRIVVDVIYLPTQRVGPREFKFVFHPNASLDD